MANMSYCRFQNTVGDLWDCLNHIHDDDLSEDEKHARQKLIDACREIIEEVDLGGDEDDEDVDYGAPVLDDIGTYED